jgi:hypothetical protein
MTPRFSVIKGRVLRRRSQLILIFYLNVSKYKPEAFQVFILEQSTIQYMSGLPDGLSSNQNGHLVHFPGLPDGTYIFKPKNPNLGKFWRVLQCKMLVCFWQFGYILWTFGIVRGNLVYFFPFGYFVPRKIWQPWSPWQRCFHSMCDQQISPYFANNCLSIRRGQSYKNGRLSTGAKKLDLFKWRSFESILTQIGSSFVRPRNVTLVDACKFC